MIVSLAELDWAATVETLRANISPHDRCGYDVVATEDLRRVTSTREAVGDMIAGLGAALSQRYCSAEQLTVHEPLVEALLRTLAHPQAPVPSRIVLGLAGPNIMPALLQLDARHLTWDADAVANLLIEDLKRYCGQHRIDSTREPWKNFWGPARETVYCLFDLVMFQTVDLL
jgi:hypothetical protein